ncbi:zinc finger CCCH domain-containing protein 18-like isoform X2 [Typha latifolia]|uniref:zinc finger CCCH domain-containing protein 18-like isoform X2 n=1 Tax=Typha latifolia TaxID=4733 RepID=UPI003C2B45A4
MEMEVSECTKIVLSRLQKLEPEHATKIIGYLLLNYTREEIMEYAFATDTKIYSLIEETKSFLMSIPNHSPQYLSSSPTLARPSSSPSSFRIPAPYWEPQLPSDQQLLLHSMDLPLPIHNQADLFSLEEQLQHLNQLEPDFSSDYFYQDAGLSGSLDARSGMRGPLGGVELPNKTCHYYYKGYCKHGTNCRYIHGQAIPEGFSSHIYSPNSVDLGGEDPAFLPGSLEKLEIEIRELLKFRGRIPVSIASLPMMYLDIYGKALQAEGYLTESQRHGKPGYSLTKLLARLKSIRLIDRPHGQHSVVLVEDSHKYLEYRNERCDQEGAIASSHQIYLTFPAESTFIEEDVLDYFRQYGPVRDVRIPRQEKRMFGFVSFLYAETVKMILAKGHPHYICGARVLVKPYKEKAKLTDRKNAEKTDLPSYYNPRLSQTDQDRNAMSRLCYNSEYLKRQQIEEQELEIELEKRLLEFQLNPKQLVQKHSLGYENLYPEDHLSEQSITKKPISCSASNYSNQDSDVDLPESPFASLLY